MVASVTYVVLMVLNSTGDDRGREEGGRDGERKGGIVFSITLHIRTENDLDNVVLLL